MKFSIIICLTLLYCQSAYSKETILKTKRAFNIITKANIKLQETGQYESSQNVGNVLKLVNKGNIETQINTHDGRYESLPKSASIMQVNMGNIGKQIRVERPYNKNVYEPNSEYLLKQVNEGNVKTQININKVPNDGSNVILVNKGNVRFKQNDRYANGASNLKLVNKGNVEKPYNTYKNVYKGSKTNGNGGFTLMRKVVPQVNTEQDIISNYPIYYTQVNTGNIRIQKNGRYESLPSGYSVFMQVNMRDIERQLNKEKQAFRKGNSYKHVFKNVKPRQKRQKGQLSITNKKDVVHSVNEQFKDSYVKVSVTTHGDITNQKNVQKGSSSGSGGIDVTNEGKTENVEIIEDGWKKRYLQLNNSSIDTQINATEYSNDTSSIEKRFSLKLFGSANVTHNLGYIDSQINTFDDEIQINVGDIDNQDNTFSKRSWNNVENDVDLSVSLVGTDFDGNAEKTYEGNIDHQITEVGNKWADYTQGWGVDK